MTYNAIRIIEVGEPSSVLYPSLDESIQIVPEPADGPLDAPLHASYVSVRRRVGNAWVNQLRASDISLQVWVTGSRLLVYCRKYNKSGGWIGFNLTGLAVAAAANAISAGVSAGLRRGKALAGGIRYPWITGVSFAPRNGRGTRETLEIQYVDGTDATKPLCSVTLHLDNHVDANRIARQITDKVIAYRYASDLPMADDARALYESLRTSGLMAPPKKGFLQTYRIPTSFKVPGGVDVLPSSAPPFPASARQAGSEPVAAPIDVASPSTEPTNGLVAAPGTCPGCGSTLVGTTFCTECGTRLLPA